MTTASKITLLRIFLIPVYMVLMYQSGGIAGRGCCGLWPFLFWPAAQILWMDILPGTVTRSAISESF